ncbi:MAG: SMC-Scp complex subunit ScpB [Pseudomonadota bacterium]|nr:SMC-Scp complex subunit ScpB [Pseudomonadota bacterium]
MSDPNLTKQIIEAALFASHEPMSLQELANLFEKSKPSKNKVKEIIDNLNNDYNKRVFEIVMVASGYRIQIKTGFDEWLQKLNKAPSNRYSKAFLETLVIIAYKQPVTRGDIENIRGVTVNPNIIRSLLEREWIKIVGHKETPGKPELLATTKKFLDYFNLKSLSELPISKDIEPI